MNNKKLREHYTFLLNLGATLLQPQKPVVDNIDPTFYHTLTAEGDRKLIKQFEEARDFLKDMK